MRAAGMREQREGSFSRDPDMCIARGVPVDRCHAWCALMQAYGNCLEAGCYIKSDGSSCELDNSPEAMARRVRKIKRLEKEKNDGRR